MRSLGSADCLSGVLPSGTNERVPRIHAGPPTAAGICACAFSRPVRHTSSVDLVARPYNEFINWDFVVATGVGPAGGEGERETPVRLRR